MKIDFAEVHNSYDHFFSIQQNQLEIFDEMVGGINEVAALDSFAGDTADNVKGYLSDIHGSVIDTFKSALMEFEVRYFTMVNEFADNVDNSSVAILDTEYIADAKKTATTYYNDFEDIIEQTSRAVAPLAGLVPVGPFSSGAVEDAYEETITFAGTVRDDLESFDAAHLNDMATIEQMFAHLTSGFSYMESALTEKSIRYNASDYAGFDWYQGMAQYRLDAVDYCSQADPNFFDSVYLKIVTDMGVPLADLLVDMVGTGIDLKEMAELYKLGTKFVLEQKDNLLVFRAIPSATGKLTFNQMNKLLQQAGIGDLGGKLTRPIFGDGLPIFNLDKGKPINSRVFNNVDDFGDALSDISNQAGAGSAVDAAKLSNFEKYLRKAGNVLNWVGWGITVVAEGHNAVYNQRSGELEWSAQNIREGVVNAGVEIGADIGFGVAKVKAVEAGAAIGTAICPGLGTAIGGVAGFVAVTVAEVAVSWKFGEPPQSLLGHGKDLLNKGIDAVGNFFSKVFW